MAVAALVMGMAGTYQFVWSSIRSPLGVQVGASETALGTVFTLFVVFQTVSQFPAGWVRDRWGPRWPMLVGAVLLVVGYLGTAFAGSVPTVYLFYGLGGIGAGTAYTVAINTPTKWTDERRGLATGVVGLAYSGASVALIPVVQGRIEGSFERTMLGLAVLVGVATAVAVPVLRDPGPGEGAADSGPAGGDADATSGGDERREDGGRVAKASEGGEPTTQYTWRETVRTWQFWLLYAVSVVVNGVGLMVVGKVVAFAEAMALPGAAAAAASLVALGDGAGVVGGGAVSDRLGRERTLAASLVLCGVCLAGATLAADAGLGVAFVGLVAASALFRSPLFSVGPSLVGDYYGAAHSSENYAALYSAKLWGGVVGGVVVSALVVRLGWGPIFLAGAALLVVAGLGTGFLRPVEQ